MKKIDELCDLYTPIYNSYGNVIYYKEKFSTPKQYGQQLLLRKKTKTKKS